MQWKIVSGLLFVLLFVCLGSVFADQLITLENCQITEDGDRVTINMLFNEKVKYHCLLLSDPERLVVDLTNVTLKKSLTSEKNSIIKSLRGSDHNHEYLRLVFDLNKKIKYSASYHDETHTLVITLRQEGELKKNSDKVTTVDLTSKKTDYCNKSEELIAEVREEVETIKLSKNLVLPPEPTLQMDNRNKGKNIVIVIDPGHGGKDPGAAGLHGTLEKEVVLKISKKLQAMLNEEPGFCAVLTRSTDYYIPLRKRLSIARKNHADMFIAIHADAYNHSHATGASVYALSQRGATSEAACWLAEKENESELGGLSDELADKDALLRSVLIDLSQTHTIESSLQIGDNLLHNLGKFTRLHHPQVEQAAFVVLKSPDIPSVLVETGFLSNPCEEEKLRDPTYQQQTAYAIKEGIKQYFKLNSPGGTWFSNNRHPNSDMAVNDEQKTAKSKVIKHRKQAKNTTKVG